MKTAVLRVLLAVGISVLLAGCASVSLTDSWKDSAVAPHKFRKILVVGFTDQPEQRQLFEDTFAGEFRQKGVDAVASYFFTGLGGKVSEREVVQALQNSAAEGVISSRVVRVQQVTDVQPGYVGGYSPEYSAAYPYPRDLYGFLDTTVFYQSATTLSFVQLTLETSLFDAATSKMVWSGTISAFDPSNPAKVGKKVAEIVITALTKEGFL